MLAPSPPPNGLPALPLLFPGSGEELRTPRSEELLSGLTLANEIPSHKGRPAANNGITGTVFTRGEGSQQNMCFLPVINWQVHSCLLKVPTP